MASLQNTEKNIVLSIDLVRNEYLDYQSERPDYMNWIPFQLFLKTSEGIVSYNSEVIQTFSVKEFKYLISSLRDVCEVKFSNNFLEEPFEYISSENLFELLIHETKEKDSVYVDLWFNLGSLTNGDIFGYSKGYRFDVTVLELSNFVLELERQLINLEL